MSPADRNSDASVPFFGKIDSARLQTFSRLVNFLLAISIVGVLVAATVTARDLFLIRDEVDRHMATVVRKGQLLSDLRAAIGYGGFIHNFKNYVLRQDDWRAEQVKGDLKRVRAILAEYRSHDIIAQEEGALDAVAATIETYAEKFELAKRDVAAGLNPKDIDRDVKVDDGPALAAMQTLQKVWNIGRKRHSDVLNEDVASGLTHLIAGGIAIPAFMLFGVALVWFQRRLVQQIRINLRVVNGLERANALNRAVLDGVNYAILATDPNGTITVFNRTAELMLGRAADTVIGNESIDRFIEPDEIVARAAQLTEALERPVAAGVGVVLRPDLTPDGTDEGEWTFIDSNGARIPVVLSVSPLHDHDGNLNGYVAIAVDITERRKMENVRREFVSTVSHELRTPLTSISGSLALVKEGVTGEVSDKARQLLSIAHSNSLRLVRLVNDILDIERLETNRIEMLFDECEMMALVDEAVAANAGYAAECDVTMRIVTRSQARVRGDGGRLLQVLANLLSNAAKFSPPGDTVEISVIRDGSEIRISVSDHGPGIPEKYHERIFQQFFQVDSSDTRRKGGTGLGLSIVKAIVERHGGRVGFDSIPNRLTTFHFALPVID